MTVSKADLGKLVAVDGLAPAHLQRAVFIAVLSFLFFLTMMIVFYIRQNILYFLLATAFLVLYLTMMVSLFKQRGSVVEVFENGLKFKKNAVFWNEIDMVTDDGEVVLANGRKVMLPKGLNEFDTIMQLIRQRSNQ